MRFVSIHPGKAEHDAECPDMGKFGAKPKPTHFRVSRPFVYRATNCAGYKDPSAREGYHTDACCATQAARITTARLAKAGAFTSGDTAETLDVQVWR